MSFTSVCQIPQPINLLLLQNKSPSAGHLEERWVLQHWSSLAVCVWVCVSVNLGICWNEIKHRNQSLTLNCASIWACVSLSLQQGTETVSGLFTTLPRSPSRVCSSSLGEDSLAALMICKVRDQQRTPSVLRITIRYTHCFILTNTHYSPTCRWICWWKLSSVLFPVWLVTNWNNIFLCESSLWAKLRTKISQTFLPKSLKLLFWWFSIANQ